MKRLLTALSFFILSVHSFAQTEHLRQSELELDNIKYQFTQNYFEYIGIEKMP